LRSATAAEKAGTGRPRARQDGSSLDFPERPKAVSTIADNSLDASGLADEVLGTRYGGASGISTDHWNPVLSHSLSHRSVRAYAAYCQMMQALELGIPTGQTEAELVQADDIKIGDIGPVMRAAGNGIELVPMKFGFPTPKPKAGPIFNFRSEGRKFADSKRCLIPASAFFEFTGTKYPKAKHWFTLSAAPFMAIAGYGAMAKRGSRPRSRC